jgi:HD-GYP domain-containing protein (c-di-GMP phosphodiesterase class II)
VERSTSIEISVRDEGPGIPDEEIPHIFKQFYRVRRESGENQEGSGLGLTIVSNIIELHGGKIEVDGGEGHGAIFSFTIPKQQLVNEDRVTVLGDVTRRREFQHLMSLLVRMTANHMGCKIVSVMLLSSSRNELYIQVAYGLDESVVRDARVPMGEGIAGRVAANAKPLLVENVEEEDGIARGNHPQYETASLISVPMRMDGEVIGVINCNNKLTREPFYPEDLSLLVTIADKVGSALSRAMRFENVREELDRTVDALEAVVRIQDEGAVTTRRAVRFAMDLGHRMGLSRRQILALQYACMVHDVGMAVLGTPVLGKRGPLSDQEREAVRSHPGRGVSLVEPFLQADDLDEIIRFHHERVDGKGYPSGLVGEHIPLAARILTVVDAYDAMTSVRPYRERRLPHEAAAELVEHAGSQFDAEVVRTFLDVLAEYGELSRDQYLHLNEGQHWLHPASL